LLNPVGIDLLLFLVSQWWQPAWLDAISWNLEIRRPDVLLDSRRQCRSKRFRNGQAEIPNPRLGGSLPLRGLSHFHARNGLEPLGGHKIRIDFTRLAYPQ
jgi:hypothetical protein